MMCSKNEVNGVKSSLFSKLRMSVSRLYKEDKRRLKKMTNKITLDEKIES